MSDPISNDDYVLVAEDDPDLREALRWALEDDGLTVVPAVDGRDAVERAFSHAPSLVVLDMSLPILDGVGVAARLRARYGAELPILVVTADGRAQQKAERIGAYGYLHKPFDVHVLMEYVRAGLERRFDSR